LSFLWIFRNFYYFKNNKDRSSLGENQGWVFERNAGTLTSTDKIT